MSKYVISDSVLTGIADAIRDKNGSQEAIKPINMASRIEEIVTNTGAFKVQSVEEMNALTDMQEGDYCIIKGVPTYIIPENATFTRFTGSVNDILNGYYADYLFLIGTNTSGTKFMSTDTTIDSYGEYASLSSLSQYFFNGSVSLITNDFLKYIWQFYRTDETHIGLKSINGKYFTRKYSTTRPDTFAGRSMSIQMRNSNSNNTYFSNITYNSDNEYYRFKIDRSNDLSDMKSFTGLYADTTRVFFQTNNQQSNFYLYACKMQTTTIDHLVYQYREGSGWIDVTDDILVPQTTITPTTSSQTPSIPAGYRGFKNITVNPVTANIDNNITPENIRAGVTILNIAGNLEPDKPDQTKIVDPTTNIQNIRPDTGYELASVTINAVTSNIDPNIIANNIRNGINILGVTGTLNEGIDTSDATAQATDIMSGMTAYVNGSKITGTIDNRRVVYKVNTYEERDTLTPQVNDMCVMWNNEYLGSFLFTNNSWLEMSVSEEGVELNEALNEIFGDDEPYEGMGGTDEEIEAVLDEILGEEEA